jgi:hypothetical protein
MQVSKTEIKNIYKMLKGKAVDKQPVWKPRSRRKENITMGDGEEEYCNLICLIMHIWHILFSA